MLNDLGIGPYELVSLPTFEEALDVAAEAIRATGRDSTRVNLGVPPGYLLVLPVLQEA